MFVVWSRLVYLYTYTSRGDFGLFFNTFEPYHQDAMANITHYTGRWCGMEKPLAGART